MKISFLTHGFATGGGLEFIRRLVGGVAAVSEQEGVTSQVVLSLDPPPEGLTRSFVEQIFSNLGSRVQLSAAGGRYVDQLEAAETFQADVILPCLEIPPADFSAAPWIGHIDDFQQKYFPKLFAPEERAARDAQISATLSAATHVIVNSKTVKSDAARFCGPSPANIHGLPYSPYPQPNWLETILDVRARFAIDRPYFVVCNQFWVHKDHATAFRAFAHLIQSGADALLVCTGSTADPRFPTYFNWLKALLDELGMNERVLILGQIAKLDQIRLLKQAIAVVQPSLFEGRPGGGAGTDAIAVGVPVIASDIPVNREIAGGIVSYFPPGDERALAEAMVALATSPQIRPDGDTLGRQGLDRRRQLGMALVDIARQAIRDRGGQ